MSELDLLVIVVASLIGYLINGNFGALFGLVIGLLLVFGAPELTH